MDTIEPGLRLTLYLGVLIQPYRVRTTRSRKAKAVTPLTTGDVAQFLEDKYEIIKTFVRVKEDKMIRVLEGSLQGGLESLLTGAPKTDPWGSATQDIMAMFSDFILSREAERVGIPGTTTLAAIKGINHRKKHPYAKANPRRASFFDTGLYVGSFRAWMGTK
jgi:hypothetical protein